MLLRLVRAGAGVHNLPVKHLQHCGIQRNLGVLLLADGNLHFAEGPQHIHVLGVRVHLPDHLLDVVRGLQSPGSVQGIVHPQGEASEVAPLLQISDGRVRFGHFLGAQLCRDGIAGF
eukprot:scaffold535_cov260-Pinguiococcus_pyrenoidosus.AAC.5